LEGEALQVEPGAHSAQVNEVELRGRASLNAGDILKQGGLVYLVMQTATPLPERRRGLDHASFMLRLEERTKDLEANFTLLLAQSSAFGSAPPPWIFEDLRQRARGRPIVLARAGADLFEGLFPAMGADDLDLVRERLATAADQNGETLRWGIAHFPSDGSTGEELWAGAVERLLGTQAPSAGELPWRDPVTAGLWSLRETLARGSRALAFLGEEGSGRETFARGIRKLASRDSPFVVHRAAVYDRARWAEDVRRAEGAALHCRHPEILPDAERTSFFQATAFAPSANFAGYSYLHPEVAGQVFVPPLRDRPADIVPIAEYLLHSVDERLARRRSSLRADVRAHLMSLDAPENVRSLRNAVLRAALSVEGHELRTEHFGLTSEGAWGSVTDMRGQLEATERHAIHEALRRARWNVSLASLSVGLPRRTLIYKMKKLGIRRPTSRSRSSR
jgi:hypothetical protein